MPEKLIVSISGLRGIVGENLTPAVAAEYGCAFGTFLGRTVPTEGGRPVVCVGRDSRPSGLMVQSAVTAGLCSAGVDVVDLGVVTTPSVGVMVRHLGCNGGVVITASHNPIPYNGIKLLNADGMAPPAPVAAQIRQVFSDQRLAFVNSTRCGQVALNRHTDDVHVTKVLGLVDPAAIAAWGFKVVLDSVNGAGARPGKRLLAALGCRLKAVNDRPTGLFAHEPEPTEKNLQGLCQVVRKARAAIGFAQDPDADRLAIVDEQGTYVGEEYTLALAALYVMGKTPGAAAANLSTSRMIDDVAARAGGQVIRTPVGEANVAEAMMERGCVIGGEGNGGVIDLRVGPVRDSLVAMALVLQLMAETGKSVHELVDQIGHYVMRKDKFTADPDQAKRIMDLASRQFAQAQVDTRDGIRFDFADGWLHLRTSNTEPIMRVIVETRDEPTAQRYLDQVRQIRSQVVGR
jgi:phosphomannomutase